MHNFTVDMTGEHLRLNTPDNHPLIRGASINPVVADSLIGRFVNPAFDDATQAKGMLDVTVVTCRNLALDTAMQSPNPAESGRAELRWSLSDLFLGQPELAGLVTKIKPNALNENGFAGQIKDGRIVIQGGQVLSDMTFEVDKYYVKFNGGIGLAENKLANFFVTLPQDMFAAIDEKFARHVPREGYRVQLSGHDRQLAAERVDSRVLPIVADLGVRAGLGSVLDRALGGRDRERDRSRTVEPAPPRARSGGPVRTRLRSSNNPPPPSRARRTIPWAASWIARWATGRPTKKRKHAASASAPSAPRQGSRRGDPTRGNHPTRGRAAPDEEGARAAGAGTTTQGARGKTTAGEGAAGTIAPCNCVRSAEADPANARILQRDPPKFVPPLSVVIG